MGITAHNKSPPDEPKELVTPAFRKLVREILKTNAVDNDLRGLVRGDPDYRWCSHAELAEAIKGDRMIPLYELASSAKLATKGDNDVSGTRHRTRARTQRGD